MRSSDRTLLSSWLRRLGIGTLCIALTLMPPARPAKADLWDCFNALVPVGDATDAVAATGEAGSCISEADTDPIMIAAIGILGVFAFAGDLGPPDPPGADDIIKNLNGHVATLLVNALQAAGFGSLADSLVSALQSQLSLTDIPVLGYYLSCASKVVGLPGDLYRIGQDEAGKISSCADTFSCLFGCDPPPQPPAFCSAWSGSSLGVAMKQVPGAENDKYYSTQNQYVDACSGAQFGWQRVCNGYLGPAGDPATYECQSCDALKGAITGNHYDPNVQYAGSDQIGGGTGGPQCTCQAGMIPKYRTDQSLEQCLCPYGESMIEQPGMQVACRKDCGYGNCVQDDGSCAAQSDQVCPLGIDYNYNDGPSGTQSCSAVCIQPPGQPTGPLVLGSCDNAWQKNVGGVCTDRCPGQVWSQGGPGGLDDVCNPCASDVVDNVCPATLTAPVIVVPFYSYPYAGTGSGTPTQVFIDPSALGIGVTAKGDGQPIVYRPLAHRLVPGGETLEIICPPDSMPNGTGTQCVLPYVPPKLDATSLLPRNQRPPRTFIVKRSNDPGAVIVKPDGLPSTVTLKVKSDPKLIFDKPEGQPTTVIVKPEGEPTTFTMRPQGQPTTVIVKPEGQPTTVILKPEGQPKAPLMKLEATPKDLAVQPKGELKTVIIKPYSQGTDLDEKSKKKKFKPHEGAKKGAAVSPKLDKAVVKPKFDAVKPAQIKPMMVAPKAKDAAKLPPPPPPPPPPPKR